MKEIVLTNYWHDSNKGDSGIVMGQLLVLRRIFPEARFTVISMFQHSDPRFEGSTRHLENEFPDIRVLESPIGSLDQWNHPGLLGGLTHRLQWVLRLLGTSRYFISHGRHPAVDAVCRADLTIDKGGHYFHAVDRGLGSLIKLYSLTLYMTHMPMFLLAYFFDPAVVGLYLIAYRLSHLPIQLISESVRQVFFQKASEEYNAGHEIYTIYKRATLGLAAIGMIPFGVLFVFGPDLFSFALGSQWEEAGRYSQWLALWIYSMFISPPSLAIALILHKQKFLLGWSSARLGCMFLALAVGGFIGSSTGAITLYGAVGGVLGFVFIGSMWKEARVAGLYTRKHVLM